jgi:dCTP deaminase
MGEYLAGWRPGMLVDHQISLLQQETAADGKPLLDPFYEWNLQPASIDLLFGNELVLYRGATNRPVHVQLMDGDYWNLHPGEFILAHTRETVQIPREFAGRVEGKSSHGRKGLMIHSQAGFIDPGFRGQLTLELFNASSVSVRLMPGMPIAQLCIFKLAGVPAKIYGECGNHYQGQTGATPAAY